MDPNLLVSVIKSQAGTLSKALLEGAMNSIDAGSPRVDITLTATEFSIRDTGRGFASEEEIRNWFGRFGTPHVEGDAVFGRFRMGRGQMFAFARSTWRSGPFCMRVDIEGRGLTYDLERQSVPTRGCTIEAQLYHALPDHRLADVLGELKKFVAYAPCPVYVNGSLFGGPAGRIKTWTYEDEDAYYKVISGATELEVYNQGVFVEAMSTWRVGMGGIVVSKAPLAVNFARNAVLEDECAVWRRISAGLERTILAKLTLAKSLDDGERRFLARRLPLLLSRVGPRALSVKVLTDPSGRHMELGRLKRYSRFVYVAEASPAACAVHGVDDTFVVTDALLTRFGISDLDAWLAWMSRLPNVLHAQATVVSSRVLADYSTCAAEPVDAAGLPLREQAAFAALAWLNTELGQRLVKAGVLQAPRSLLVGHHKRAGYVAWTDGKSFITANRKHLRRFALGLQGVAYWLQVLVHEYTHDCDDSESHSHGEVFYRRFHDTLLDNPGLDLGQLAQAGLVTYLTELSNRGVARPRVLSRQLKPRYA